MFMGRLDGKIAIITGGTSGIGARSVERFVEEGATVVFCGRRDALGEALAAEVGAGASFVHTDVTVEAEVEALIKGTVEQHGRIDILFNNAGGPAPTGSITSIEMAAYQRAMDVLVTGVVHGMKHVAPVMIARGAGSIVNNGSVAAHQAGWSSSMIYAAAKAAVVHLSRCAAMELGEKGVRVNSVSPGAIATGIFGKALGLSEDKAEETANVMKEAFAEIQPIKRAGMPDDVANAAVFLASDEASFINGRDLVVDGGLIGGRQWGPQQQSLSGLRAAFDAMG
jgi:NAD(P)-dependent dehydrogenase (short-subunit alcohol dehydrogenase family)